ncbi:C40 family peptidase [Paenibacillus sp. IB182496]|uniref:C40 family peptidase n=1 Tax=Paenibacillus sabuli TaxID=2772509 RepID=A0A927BX43_9BACL|nr:C40 family peptidase [Paenibacillus sabuli]MBD2847957.1 C40 family peptidase [Paenibacillus sabuli]
MFMTRLIRKVIIAGLVAVVSMSAASAVEQAPVASAASASVTKANNIINTGEKYLGVRYKFGAPSGVTYAFDCSSFTQYVYKRNGISLPRTSKAQSKKGAYVSKSNLKKGDLVFFSVPSRGSGVGHVAIYAGNGRLLHTYGTGGVRYSSLNASYWKKNYVTARRVI